MCQFVCLGLNAARPPLAKSILSEIDEPPRLNFHPLDGSGLNRLEEHVVTHAEKSPGRSWRHGQDRYRFRLYDPSNSRLRVELAARDLRRPRLPRPLRAQLRNAQGRCPNRGRGNPRPCQELERNAAPESHISRITRAFGRVQKFAPSADDLYKWM